MILIINHINFLEVPLIQVCMMPRKMRGLVKNETWRNPILRFFLNTYHAIPIYRKGVNISAFREVKKYLAEGEFICLAPEGTRSGNGILHEGKAGITTMALMTGAPIIPVVHYGGEDIWKNLKRFRRTKVTFKVGRPFLLKTTGKIGKVTSKTRKEITKEVMCQMALLLPKEMRGIYSDLSNISADYLLFLKQ